MHVHHSWISFPPGPRTEESSWPRPDNAINAFSRYHTLKSVRVFQAIIQILIIRAYLRSTVRRFISPRAVFRASHPLLRTVGKHDPLSRTRRRWTRI